MTPIRLSTIISRVANFYDYSDISFDKLWHEYTAIGTWSLLAYIIKEYYKENNKHIYTPEDFLIFVKENEVEFYYDLSYILSRTDKDFKIKEIYTKK